MNHSLVERLRNNPNWKPAADAAVDFFVDDKKCTVPSWIKSSTWKQVEMAYEEIKEALRHEGEIMEELGRKKGDPQN